MRGLAQWQLYVGVGPQQSSLHTPMILRIVDGGEIAYGPYW